MRNRLSKDYPYIYENHYVLYKIYWILHKKLHNNSNILHTIAIFVVHIIIQHMKETLSSISKRLGISTSTISRILSGKAQQFRIKEDTVAKVMEEVARCNYAPSTVAQSLRTNKTHTIGVIIPSVSNPYFADIAGAIISEARSKGYAAMVLDTMESEQNQRLCLATLVSRKVDGIIAVPCGNNTSLFEEIDKNIPIVLVDRYFSPTKLSYVTTNNFKGAYDATQHLINNGHKNIVCIQGDKDSLPNIRRVDGFRKALQKAGIEDTPVITGDAFSIQNGYLETKLLLNRQNLPSAIFALSYTILLGVIKALNDSGIRVPEDISIVSFDDNLCLDYMTPAITRIGQPTEEMGRMSTKLLFEKMENHDIKPTQIELSANFIIRESVSNL